MEPLDTTPEIQDQPAEDVEALAWYKRYWEKAQLAFETPFSGIGSYAKAGAVVLLILGALVLLLGRTQCHAAAGP